jgi:signal transduction histidine kinase
MEAGGREQPLLLLVSPDGEAPVRRALDSLGYRTLVVPTAVAASAAASTEHPDACVLVGASNDARASTLAECRALKGDLRTARVPLLLLSADSDATTVAKAVEAGADDVLPVDQDPALLNARMQALLRLKSATDALDESARRLRELEKVRDDLMQMIVHDLKTPLTSVLATLEILGDGDLGPVSDEQGRAVLDMRARGDELLQLIDDLLQVWRIESTSLPLKPEPIVPSVFFEELLREWEYRFRHESARVSIDVAPDTNSIRADRGLLRRVFGNLLQNALVHSPTPVELKLSARSDRRGVLFTVADNGSGIPREYHEVIFRTFHRLPRPNERRVRGSGLGLAFCRLAVEAHGGRIWVQSEEGQGSQFHVLMPLDPATALMRRAWNL